MNEQQRRKQHAKRVNAGMASTGKRRSRRDPVTKDRNEEVTHFTKYRDAGEGVQWPFAIERDRNGEKIYEIFSTSVEINDKKASADTFMLPSSIKLLKPE